MDDTTGSIRSEPPAQLQPSTIQRLALIRYLYAQGIEQSRLPEPMGAVAILMFHDSVELFLQLVSEHLNVGKQGAGFMEYWTLIDPGLSPERLGQRESMRRLNSARVAFKHHGTLPSSIAIEQFRANVTSFFEECTPLVFGIEFAAISMIDLVRSEAARASLREARGGLTAGRYERAMSAVTIAFAQLKDEINDRLEGRFHRSPFTFGVSIRPIFRSGGGLENELVDAIGSIQGALTVLAFGLDYRDYVRFRLLTPTPYRTNDGQYTVVIGQGLVGSIDWPPTLEACEFCFNFVIESALKIQLFDVEALVGPAPAGSPAESEKADSEPAN